jgi:hypothetical protein
MSLTLNEIVPFGRTYREYEAMFALTPADMQGRILGCGDGPASFNAEATAAGCDVTSIDPIYQFSAEQIRQKFSAIVGDIIDQIRRTSDNWVWTFHAGPDELHASRCATVEKFAADFPSGKQAGRYMTGQLPQLPFPDQAFDLALCSHLLFLYSDHLTAEFHVESVLELCRVAREVRIFPLVTLSLQRSPYIEPVCRRLNEAGRSCEIVQVPYELQRGGNQMLRIVKAQN